MSKQPEVYNITEFRTAEFPEKQYMLGRWLASSELCLLFAGTGEGKSFFAASLAHSVATGGEFLGFRAARPFRVAIVEAELERVCFQQRIKQIDDASPIPADPRHFRIIRRNQKDNYLPNISTPEGAAQIEALVKDFDLVVIDNLTTAAPPTSGKDSEVDIWHRVREFLFRLRNAGKTVILVHHAGKSGSQLGTVLKENDQDTIIHIRRPIRPLNPSKLSMEVTLQKSRSLSPEDRLSLYAEFTVINDQACWWHRPLKDARAEMIRIAAQATKNKKAIADYLKIPIFEVLEVLDAPEPTTFKSDVDPFEEDVDEYF